MAFLDSLRKRWHYWMARSDQRFDERADPKVQLEQALAEAQDQHRRLKEQAASVIANQKLSELQLNRAMGELEELNIKARQAVLMADEARKRGDTTQAQQLDQAAETFAAQLLSTEKQVESLKELQLKASQAADQAKQAVAQNAAALQTKLTERQKLMSQLDQAKMQEQMNTAMATLSETIGQDVPTFDEVRTKIEARYAKALGASELAGQSLAGRTEDVTQLMAASEARARLGQIKAQLGLESGAPASAAISAASSDAADSVPTAQAPAENEPTRPSSEGS